MNGLHQGVLAVFHWLEYIGLLSALGSFVVRRLARIRPRIGWADPPMHIALGLALIGSIGLLVFGPETVPVMARVVAEAIALMLCLRGIPYVAVFAALAAALLPFSDHAAAVQPPAGAELADAVHVLSAGMWAGGILALASLRPPGGWKAPEARALLERFARVALIAFGVTALTGVLRATEQLTGVSDLWRTSYGITLTLKSAGVVVMLLLSSMAWRRGAEVARVEAVVAGLVVAATALLAVLPSPA